MGGPFTDNLPGLLTTGSSNITMMDISNQSVSDVRYTWKCSTLKTFLCDNNGLISTFDYNFPNTLQTMSCHGCSLLSITDLLNTSLGVMNCADNFLITLPKIPDTITFLNCSDNNISVLQPFSSSVLNYLNFGLNNLVSLPSLPNTLHTIIGDRNSISSILTLPDNVISASFALSPLNNFTLLPASLSYFDINNTSVLSLPSLPISTSYLDISHALFSTASLEAVASNLISNAQISGTFKMTGYGPPPSFAMVVYIAQLSSSLGWTVVTD